MKKYVLLISIAILLFTQTSCLISVSTEKGNGRVTRIQREIDSFTEVNSFGSATVIIE